MVFNSLSLSMSENKYVRTLQKADRQAALKQMAARAIQATSLARHAKLETHVV